MDNRYTVREIAQLAGVSPRTLHYYDEIGILNPAAVGENGYRFYDEDSLLRLQQILLYREMGVELAQIQRILDDAEFDQLSALQAHQQKLRFKIERLEQLVQTVEITIQSILEDVNMSAVQIFQGFDKEKQERYAKEAESLWGDTVKASVALWKSYSKEKQKEVLAEGDAIYTGIVAQIDKGAESAEVQALLGQWHNHIRYFYEPTIEVLGGLGNMYYDDPQFNATFTKIDPRLPGFLKEAIAIYVDRLETEWLESEVGSPD